jgi:hypothetical protein
VPHESEAANLLASCDATTGLLLSPKHESMLRLKDILKASLKAALPQTGGAGPKSAQKRKTRKIRKDGKSENPGDC